MEKKPYEKPQITDLGSIQELTLGNVGGSRQDNKIVQGSNPTVFGTLSGNPLVPARALRNA